MGLRQSDKCIIGNSGSLQGGVNVPYAKLNYIGVESATNIVNVNNTDNTISVLSKDFHKLQKESDFLYTLEYDRIDYAFGKEYIETKHKPQGACSIVTKGNIVGRDFDWYYNWEVTTLVKVNATNNNYASIGNVGAVPQLTKQFVESGEYNEIYEVAPFLIIDGVNEYGLFAGTNVVHAEKGPTLGTTPLQEQRESLCQMMLPRYILDHYQTADEAVNDIVNHISVYASKVFLADNLEAHILIKDANHCYILEFIDNAIVVTENTAMTNFYIGDVTFNEDGTVYTPETQDNEHSAIRTNKVSPLGMGLERWNIIQANYDSLEDAEDMTHLMKDLLNYNNAYSLNENIWYSEFTGENSHGYLTVDSTKEEYEEYIIPTAKEKFAERDRNQDKQGVWHTTHTAIYDLVNKTVSIYDSSEDGVKHTFTLSSTKDVWEKGSGLHSIQAKDSQCFATGDYSLASGFGTQAEANYGHAEGFITKVASDSEHDARYGHSEGYMTYVGGLAGHAEGDTTYTQNIAEHAEGRGNKSHKDSDSFGSAGNTIHSIGIGTNNQDLTTFKNAVEVMQNGDFYVLDVGGYDGKDIEGKQTLQEVINNKSSVTNLENGSGVGSLKQIVEPGKEHVAGPDKDEDYGAVGNYSTVLGATSRAEGKRSFAHGTQNASRGGSSHAEGDSTETGVDAYGAHSEGYKTKTDAPYSHVEGWGNKVIREITSSVDDEGISGVWIIKDFSSINIPATVTENINFSYVKSKTGETVNGTRMYLENKPAKNISSIENGTYVTLQYNGSYSTLDHEINFGSVKQYPSAGFLAAVKGAMTKKVPAVTRYINAGNYKFNDRLEGLISLQNISFISNNQIFYSIKRVLSESYNAFMYYDNTFVCFDDHWDDGGKYQSIQVLSKTQVTEEFYQWFNANTTVVQPLPPALDDSNGDISHTEGIGNITLGWATHTEGQGNRNYAHYSSVKGANNTAGRLIVKSSTHEGHTTITKYMASGNSIDVGGSGNKAQYSNQFVRGTFNDNKSDTLLEIGNGSDDEHRSNAFEVYEDGTIYATKLTDGITTKTITEILSGGGSAIKNLEDGTVKGSLQQKQDGTDGTFDFTGKNPNAISVHPELNGLLLFGAQGEFASSFGGKGQAKGKRSHQEGTTTLALGNYSHVEGNNSVSYGPASHSEGSQCFSNGDNAHSEGESTQSLGRNSHSEGYKTNASANNSHAEGVESVASGDTSHAEGNKNISSGTYSHTEGNNNRTTGWASHTEGQNNQNSGTVCHVGGLSSIVNSGTASIVHGKGLYTTQDNVAVFGSYNKATDAQDIIFGIGNGSDDSHRSNAISVYKDGHAEIGSMGNTNLSVATKQYVDEHGGTGGGTQLYKHSIYDREQWIGYQVISTKENAYTSAGEIYDDLYWGSSNKIISIISPDFESSIIKIRRDYDASKFYVYYLMCNPSTGAGSITNIELSNSITDTVTRL